MDIKEVCVYKKKSRELLTRVKKDLLKKTLDKENTSSTVSEKISPLTKFSLERIKKLQERVIMGNKLALDESYAGQNSFPGSDITFTPTNYINNPMAVLGCLNPISTTSLPVITLNTTTNNMVESRTPFTSNITLTSDVSMYNISAIANGYSNVTLSQEGLLWTLWPLVKPNKSVPKKMGTYFDDFTFGTSTQSRYPIGQMGYFYQQMIMGCIPMISSTDYVFSGLKPVRQTVNSGLSPDSSGMFSGIQGFEETLILNTGQQLAVLVIKVSEQIARIFNPIAGISAVDRYIYVGYDGWSIVLSSTNPRGPMAAQTYITPSTITGNESQKNYNVIIPPNFPNTVYYKNFGYTVPVSF